MALDRILVHQSEGRRIPLEPAEIFYLEADEPIWKRFLAGKWGQENSSDVPAPIFLPPSRAPCPLRNQRQGLDTDYMQEIGKKIRRQKDKSNSEEIESHSPGS
jgi:hypothetical protein